MKKLLQEKLIIIALLSIVIVACGKDDTPEIQKEDAKEHTLSRATDYGNDWIYFSFEKGKEIEGITEDTRSENLDWDIAFNKSNMRTNGGKSGKGKGAAVEIKNISSLAEVNSVPTTGFKEDEIIQITKNISSFPPPSIETPGSKVLGNAIKFSGPPPKYTISDNVFVIRTAGGQYVKFKVISYYNKKAESGYVTFKYAPIN